MTAALLSPVRLGLLELPNRVIMAPLTRCRAENPDTAPDERMARYYAQRAGAGLIVSEGAIVSARARSYPHTPGIWSDAQISGWRLVTDAVHAAGGRIVCQLWHCGRLALPQLTGGEAPLGPSAIDAQWKMFSPTDGPRPTVAPQAMSCEDIAQVVEEFAQGARNAVRAGFDGIELHSSNGYLIHQFLAGCSNTRDDEYGGSIENRARLLFEVLDAVTGELPAGRVGFRLNPMMHKVHGMRVDDETLPTFEHVVQRANEYGLAYLHLTEAYAPGQLDDAPVRLDDVAGHFRPLARMALVSNGGFEVGHAETQVAGNKADAVAFGRAFIANPDLVERIRRGAPLARWDTETFYQGGERGYIDYPTLA